METKRTSTIQYPIAKDKHGDWVHISEAEREKRYYCPECGGRFTPRLGQTKAHHFAHYPGYKTKCTGETTYHSRGKHILKYHFDTKERFEFKTRCRTCGYRQSYKGQIDHIAIEKGEETLRPDVLIKLKSGKTIFGEVVYRHDIDLKKEMYCEKNEICILRWEVSRDALKFPGIETVKTFEEAKRTGIGANYGGKVSLILPKEYLKCVHPPYIDFNLFKNYPCVNCKKGTKVALLRYAFPLRIDDPGAGGLAGPGICFDYHEYLKWDPALEFFAERINKKYGTHWSYDSLRWGRYLTNHCEHCGIKIPDGYIPGLWKHEDESVTSKVFCTQKQETFPRKGLINHLKNRFIKVDGWPPSGWGPIFSYGWLAEHKQI